MELSPTLGSSFPARDARQASACELLDMPHGGSTEQGLLRVPAPPWGECLLWHPMGVFRR